MPYLIQEDRDRLKKNPTPKTAADMNYLINITLYERFKNSTNGTVSSMYAILHCILTSFILKESIRYQRINDSVGALICGVFEFIRRNPCKLSQDMIDTLVKSTNDFIWLWYQQYISEYEDKKKEENGDIYE